MSSGIPPITGPGGGAGGGFFDASLVWRSNAAYAQGAQVVPTADVPQFASSLPDDYFQSNTLSAYSSSGGWTIGAGNLFQGNAAFLPAGSGSNKSLITTTRFPVIVGQVVTAGLYSDNNVSDSTQSTFVYCVVFWYNSGGTLIGQTVLSDTSNQYFTIGNGVPPPGQTFPTYSISQVTATAPSGAATASIGCIGTNTSVSGTVIVEGFVWIYSKQNNPDVRYFTAIQNGSGTSGSIEPTWPSSGSVNDGSCVWETGVTSIIKWVAININTTGSTQPTWPTTVGATVADGNMYWQCQTPAITDANCPQTKYVITASSKIYAGDNDIVRFSATTNPTDWTSEADAGFLGTGLQSYGANPVTALGLYRSNLVVFNSQGLQMWQIDEDPANMSLLDAIPIGTTYQRALSPVNNDLFFLSPQGVRTMGISVASSNLSAGDVGMPIDVIIQAARAWADANSVDPIATYFPSAGQYWLAFPGWPDSGFFQNPGTSQTTNVFVYTMNRVGEVGAWSRYLFPFVIENFCQNGNDLYIRCNTAGQTGSDIVKIDVSAMQDFASDTHGRAAYFTGVVQWPWLDFGTTGTTKKLDGIDVVATSTGGTANISVGYDQSNTSRMTTPFAIAADTLPGNFIPIALMSPSFSVSITFSSQYDWQIKAVNVYVQDQRITA